MKQFNWEEFKDESKKIAVHCKTREEAEDFLKLCAENGIEWKSGSEITGIAIREAYDSFEYGSDTIYLFLCGGFGYGSTDVTGVGMNILEWSDFMQTEESKRKKTKVGKQHE